ncbi:MAG: class I SAM-dependent methyltransferase [Spirochaetaceae bacterium]|nr:MAG: class I SAM-dependent methyltransferase [Spirochaetaceae bacterium]
MSFYMVYTGSGISERIFMWFFRFLRAVVHNFFHSFRGSPESGILSAMEQQEIERVLVKTGVDVLYIDTSHRYEHTVSEINNWFPLLGEKATVIFHDTNLRTFFKRRDGSMGAVWNNHRGVIRAIEEHFKTQFDETQDFSEKLDGFEITHYSHCNGFTVLNKI